jgi:hypothetical protein
MWPPWWQKKLLQTAKQRKPRLIIVIGDVHGYINKLPDCLQDCNYQPIDGCGSFSKQSCEQKPGQRFSGDNISVIPLVCPSFPDHFHTTRVTYGNTGWNNRYSNGVVKWDASLWRMEHYLGDALDDDRWIVELQLAEVYDWPTIERYEMLSTIS